MRYNHDMIGTLAVRVNGPASAATLRANQGTYLEANGMRIYASSADTYFMQCLEWTIASVRDIRRKSSRDVRVYLPYIPLERSPITFLC